METTYEEVFCKSRALIWLSTRLSGEEQIDVVNRWILQQPPGKQAWLRDQLRVLNTVNNDWRA